MNGQRAFTDAQVRELHRRYWHGGERIKDLSREHGISKYAILWNFHRLELPVRPKPGPSGEPKPEDLRVRRYTKRLIARYDAIRRARMNEDSDWLRRRAQ